MTREKSVAAAEFSPRREQLIVLILAAVQFITIVDFMIVMPLAPQLMRTFDITTAQFGLIVSSYTFAAGAAGLVASSIVDRFARRTSFMAMFAGFLLGTLWCAVAPTYETLVAARIVAGAFGGILGGMAMAIIGDVFPEERRGRATGSLMTGFALASVAGVPFGLYLGTNFGWHIPFVALVVAGLPALLLTPFALPPLNAHVGKDHPHPLRSLVDTFSIPNHLRAFALIVTLMIGNFSVFPYLSAYLVGNVGVTEDQLPFAYIAGGIGTFIAAPIIGRLADRFGKLTIYRCVAPCAAVMMLAITHLPRVSVAFAVILFGTMMVCNVGRMIPAMALVTSSVEPRRRGGFLSANAAVQHLACGVGAYVGGEIIAKGPDGQLEHFGVVGWFAVIATIASIWIAGRVRIVDAAVAQPVSAEAISLAAAAEAEADAGEPLLEAASKP